MPQPPQRCVHPPVRLAGTALRSFNHDAKFTIIFTLCAGIPLGSWPPCSSPATWWSSRTAAQCIGVTTWRTALNSPATASTTWREGECVCRTPYRALRPFTRWPLPVALSVPSARPLPYACHCPRGANCPLPTACFCPRSYLSAFRPSTLRPAGTQPTGPSPHPWPHQYTTRLFIEALPKPAATYHKHPTGICCVPSRAQVESFGALLVLFRKEICSHPSQTPHALTPHRYLLFTSRLASREEQQALLAQLQVAWDGLRQVPGQLAAQEGGNQVG